MKIVDKSLTDLLKYKERIETGEFIFLGITEKINVQLQFAILTQLIELNKKVDGIDKMMMNN